MAKSPNSRMHYKPFGDSIELARDEVGYTGHKFDTDLNLSYMQARYYDPVIGRFMSNDPVGFSNVYNFNRYSYANNNPFKYVDPDGETSWPVNKNKNGQVVLTSGFGKRNTGIKGASTNHNAQDFRARKGAEILAPQDGKVSKILSGSKGGNAILVSNDDGSMNGFAHTKVDSGLKIGDTVKEGSVIGTSDGSGTGNAAHLHLTFREGTPAKPATSNTPKVDPMKTQFKNMPKSEVCVKSKNNSC